MAKAEGTQHKLSRVRPPRVQITYDVEIGDAIEKKELPYIVGIMADLSGNPTPEEKLPPVKDRKFIEIDRDNFQDVLEAIHPRVVVEVDNMLTPDSKDKISVELRFKHLDDFGPVEVLKQVPQLKRLFEARSRLRDLLTKLDGNAPLDGLLAKVMDKTDGAKASLQSDLQKLAPTLPPVAAAAAAAPAKKTPEQEAEEKKKLAQLAEALKASGAGAEDKPATDSPADGAAPKVDPPADK